MKNINADEYIAQRLDDQIAWYDRKSLASQRWYKYLRLTEFVAAAFIPFLTAIPESGQVETKFIIGLLGVGIAVITATLGLYQFQEHWIEYRTTCESLKKEKYLFLTSSKPYDWDQAEQFQLLVQRVETLVSRENTNWAQYMLRPKEESKNA